MAQKTILEYIWLDSVGGLRSKTRVLYNTSDSIYIPDWNYDGSSTGQSDINGNSEIVLKPCKNYKNPLTPSIPYTNSFLVLCDTWNIDRHPIASNTRFPALQKFNLNGEIDQPWFGLEQEYYMVCKDWPDIIESSNLFYCGCSCLQLGKNTDISPMKIQRQIVEEHMIACLNANLNISGTNAEVAPNQWEFQIGPCLGIDAADELYVARFLLQRIAEKYGVSICYEPKMNPYLSGSGGHTNFSTIQSRSEGGIQFIYDCMEKLKLKHGEHMLVYGKDNDQRLTGQHETAHFSKFSYGIGTRNTSIRIPTETAQNNCGYFEDRRPGANFDPYLVTSILYETCITGNLRF